GVFVPHQLHGPGVQVLFGKADAFAERRRNGLVKHLHTGAWAFIDLNAVEARVFFAATRADSPHLTWLQRVAANSVVALQLRRRDKLLHAVGAHDVAEVRIAKLGSAHALLQLFCAAPSLHSDANSPFQIFVRNWGVRARIQQHEQTADRLADRIGVAARQSTAKEDAVLQFAHPTLVPKLAPALGQEVADQAEVVGDQILVDLGHIPTRQERMDAVHKGGVVTHHRRHGAKQVPNALLMFYIDVEVADHHDAAVGADRSEEHTSELQSRENLVCRLLLEKKKTTMPKPVIS